MTTRTRQRRQAGMTLIEIMIVIAVLGMMVGMLVVGFGGGRQAEVGRATNQIANTVRYGFDKARVNGQYFRMVINLDDGTFSLQNAEDAMYLPATDRDGKIIEIDKSDLEEQADRDMRAEQSFNRSVQSAAYRDQPGGGGDGGTGGDDGFDVYKPQPRKVPRARPPLFAAFEDENSLSDLAKPFKIPEGTKITYVRTADDLHHGRRQVRQVQAGRGRAAAADPERRQTVDDQLLHVVGQHRPEHGDPEGTAE
jgi:general secretion pathway protein H